jgi:hypothetical protein
MSIDHLTARPHSAVRVDEAGGYQEILEFFGDGDERLAGCTNLPLGEIVGGVVVCSSLYNEYMKNYRREVVLGRALAAEGIAVQRFSYRGTGNSDGEPEDTTFESLQDDARAAAGRLLEVAGVRRPSYLATRFGALVAGGAAADGAPLALLEPVLEANRFFLEGIRAKASGDVVKVQREAGAPGVDASAGPTTMAAFVELLDAAGAVDVLGYTVGRDFYHSASGRTLSAELGAGPRPILLMQLGGATVSQGLVRAADAWRAGGCDVEIAQAGEREQWWFAEERMQKPGEAESKPHGLTADDPVVATVCDWLVRQLTGAAGAAAHTQAVGS